MSVFFVSHPVSDDSLLTELWYLLENEHFEEAAHISSDVCQHPDTPIEFFCGLSLAYGELGFYDDSEQIARTAIGLGAGSWLTRYALAVALMHQGRFLGALDVLGAHRDPEPLYVVRAQIETMGNYVNSLKVTLEDALEKIAPPAIQLYLAYLYGTITAKRPDWSDQPSCIREIIKWGNYLTVWEHDANRHYRDPYGIRLAKQVGEIDQLLSMTV